MSGQTSSMAPSMMFLNCKTRSHGDVVEAIEPSLRLAEIERVQVKPTADLGAYDLLLKAMSELSSTYTEQSLSSADALLRAALERDPEYSDAWAALATTIFLRRMGGYLPHDEAARLGFEAAYRAVNSDPQNPSALASAAATLAIFGLDLEQAVEFADRALSLAPNSAPVLTFCGYTYNYAADFDRALSLLEKARRLSPRDPRGFVVHNQITVSHFFSRRFDAAIESGRRAVKLHPAYSSAWRYLAAALAHAGRVEEAREAIVALLKVQPNSTVGLVKSLSWYHSWMIDLFVEGLRKAGLPE